MVIQFVRYCCIFAGMLLFTLYGYTEDHVVVGSDFSESMNTRRCPSIAVRCYMFDTSKKNTENITFYQDAVATKFIGSRVKCTSSISKEDMCDACNKHFATQTRHAVTVKYLKALFSNRYGSFSKFSWRFWGQVSCKPANSPTILFR